MARDSWRNDLARHRRAVGLTQAGLALQAGVSVAALRAYENGARDPAREVLSAILDVLKLGLHERNAILFGAGFASDSATLAPARAPTYYFTLEQARTEIESHPWPAAVQSDVMEVLGANRILQRIWGVDLAREFQSPVERNILSVLTDPRFEGRLQNFEAVLEVALSVVKGHHLGPETAPEGSSAYFAAVMQHFMTGVPALVTRLAEAWVKTEPIPWKVRWSCPIVWRDPAAGVMRFTAMFTPASEHDGLAFMDWLPLDAATWVAVENLRLGRPEA